MSKIAIIQLARIGDIVSILPVAKFLADAGHEITIYAHADFCGVLDAVSYVKTRMTTTTHRDVEGMAAKAWEEGADQVIVSQFNGNDEQPPIETENYQTNQWSRTGLLHKFHELPLIFDNRKPMLDERAIKAHVPIPDGRPLLTFNLSSHSSPMPGAREFRDWIIKTFGRNYRLLDLTGVMVPMVHSLLGILEMSDVLLTLDTLTLHLAYATGTPTIALQPNIQRLRSEPRTHWIERATYSEALTEEGKKLIQRAVEDHKKIPLGGLIRTPRAMERSKVDIVMHYYGGYEPDETSRILNARETWTFLKNEDSAVSIRFWQMTESTRNSKNQLGDSRRLPYFKDIVDASVAESRETDCVCYINTDICLVQDAALIIREKLKDEPCCFSARVDMPMVSARKRYVSADLARSRAYAGTDLFAFRPQWWRDNRSRLPDFVIGCEAFDFVVRWAMKMSSGDPELKPIAYHAMHNPFWAMPANRTSNPAQAYNRRICAEWAIKNGLEGALNADGQFLFKADSAWTAPPVESLRAAFADTASVIEAKGRVTARQFSHLSHVELCERLARASNYINDAKSAGGSFNYSGLPLPALVGDLVERAEAAAR